MSQAPETLGRQLDCRELDRVMSDLDRCGYAVIPEALQEGEANLVLARLWAAAEETERRGESTFVPILDPNDKNVRVFNLIDLDPLFGRLVVHPIADAVVGRLLGADYIISNFTANIARPGSGSMMVHSDLSFVAPEPWVSADSVNIIWCLTDVRADNGATLHLPGSHHLETRAEVPDDPVGRMVPLEAPIGSIVVMEGRVWHTSGANITEAEDRALLFGYYSKPHIRPQVDHNLTLSTATKATFNGPIRRRLNLSPA